jgi:hypothetical protein
MHGMGWERIDGGYVYRIQNEVVGSVWKVGEQWWGMAAKGGARPYESYEAARRGVETRV